MADAIAEDPSRTPWTLRIYDLPHVAPWQLGLALSAGFFGSYLVLSSALGWVHELERHGERWLILRLELIQAAMIGYAPTAAAYAVRGATRHLQALGPQLELDAAGREQERTRLTCFDARWLHAAAAVGILLGVVIPFTPGYWLAPRPGLADPLLAWNILRVTVLAFLVTRTIYIEAHLALRFSRLGEDYARVDLLDLEPLSPFTRRALGGVLRPMLYAAMLGLLLLSPFSKAMLLVFIVVLTGAAVAMLVLPMRGIHRRILSAKRRELARVRDAIRSEREPVIAGGGEGSRLSQLLAYEARIASASTWPFDTATYLRFALYVSLGLGSWFGSAVVERLLDTALD